MSGIWLFLRSHIAVAFVLALTACDGFTGSAKHSSLDQASTASTSNILNSLDGPTLYKNNCLACHGELAQSTKRNRSAQQIMAALQGVPTMTSLAFLSDVQISAIAQALSTAPVPVTCTPNPNMLAKAALRRLNAREFVNSLRDVLGVSVDPASLPKNDLNGMGFDTDGAILRLVDLDASKYMDVVQAAVAQRFAATVNPAYDYTCPATTAEATNRTCTSTKLSLVARRAFKRPISAAELKVYVDLARHESVVADGLQSAIAAMLMSPNFLYLSTGLTSTGANGIYTLTDLELAHKLALMIWSSVPDETLLTVADSGTLKNSPILRAQVARMVADTKFNTGLGQGFVDHWLELYKLIGTSRVDSSLPSFSDAHIQDMVQESRLFVQYLVRNDKPIAELLTAPYSFVNQRLAQVYGVSGTFTTGSFPLTQLPTGQRSGLLTHASIMTLTGKLDSTSPVKRGFWMTKRILCTEPPPPPPDIPQLNTSPTTTATVKERLAAHRTNVTCAGCHAQMDPIGIGLENFSQIGKWRTSYLNAPVDASEVFEQQSFNGPTQLAAILSQRDDVKLCFTKHLATYSLGRSTDTVDDCFMNHVITNTNASTNKGLLTLIQEMVDSPMFKQQRDGG